MARAQSRQDYPTERRRYLDPATEFEVFRLTEPTHSSYLPLAHNEVFARRSNSLIYCSDRDGSLQAYAMSLRDWSSRKLSDAKSLDRYSLTVTPDGRGICFLDGGSLFTASLGGGRGRKVYDLPPGYSAGRGLCATSDGPSAIFVARREEESRLTMVSLLSGKASIIARGPGVFMNPVSRPKRASTLYGVAGQGLWLAYENGARNYRLKTAPGGIGPAIWAPDGKTVLYIHYPEEAGKSHTLRQNDPDSGEDKPIAPTSQFVVFSSNRDASVFVGASGSKASPYVLLLIRAARRELTLCEHRTSSPEDVAPVFSPDSQSIFFMSDRHGKPALYSMRVDRLVEKTES